LGRIIGAASAQDVMARFGLGRTVCYRTLAALVDDGLPAPDHPTMQPPRLRRSTRRFGKRQGLRCSSPSWLLDGAAAGVMIG
jgi:hypothetical protein